MTTETKAAWTADEAQRVIESLEEEVKRAECMAKVHGQEQRICVLWRIKADDLRTAADMIRRAYLGGSDT